jgi:hypothetical protein
MSVTDSDLVEQMAKKHAVSPAAVEVVLAALRNRRPDGPIQPRRFWGDVAMVAGNVHGGRHVQYATEGQAQWAMQRYLGTFGRRSRYCWLAIWRRRGQLPFSFGIARLVADWNG